MKEYFFEKKSIYYRTNNISFERPTLVFIHGLTASSSGWYEYEERFLHTYNIVSLDLRGHGASIKYKKYQDYTIPLLAEDVVDLIGHLGVDRIVFVGHSFGALIALQAALRISERIIGHVFISPTFSEENSYIFIKKISRWLCSFNLIPLIASGTQHIDYSKYKGFRDGSFKRFFADVWSANIAPYVYCVSQLYSFHYYSLLESLVTTTLAVHGRYDSVSSCGYIEKVLGTVQAVELIIFETDDHTLALNSSERVMVQMEKFFHTVL